MHLSPLAVKDEGEKCRPHVIMDHTWFDINDHTVVELPPEVMQFSGMLSCILWLLQHADPNEGPVYMAKFDISNGFYHLFLDPDDAPKLAVLMLKYDRELQLVAMPLSLTAGWVLSLPTFCAASKTATDIINASLFCHTVPLHQLKDTASDHDCWGPPQQLSVGLQPSSSLSTIKTVLALALPLPQPEDHALLTKHKGPVAHVNVFVDDFIGIMQGSWCHCQNVRQCIMHAVDDIFSQLDAITAKRKEAVSEKKLLKGEGRWSQWKEILGWILDTSWGTLELTNQQKSCILAIFDDLHHKGQVGIKKWQWLLGKLRFMGPAVPGASGLFKALQLGLSHADKQRICIT